MTTITRTPELFGQALRRTRKKRSLTQSELAERSGLWQETISKIERGAPGTRLDSAMQICAALDLEIVVRERTKGNTDYLDETL